MTEVEDKLSACGELPRGVAFCFPFVFHGHKVQSKAWPKVQSDIMVVVGKHAPKVQSDILVVGGRALTQCRELRGASWRDRAGR